VEQREAPARASVRLDKWLWAARLFKTRSLAAKACTGGHVKVNGEASKPARAVRVGDELEVFAPGGRRLVRVAALGEKRGPAAVARSLYEDHTPAPDPRALEDRALFGARARGAGRPTKRDRRLLIRARGR
jgi:ribosome-associated heat shock protein Hsp15